VGYLVSPALRPALVNKFKTQDSKTSDKAASLAGGSRARLRVRARPRRSLGRRRKAKG